jgi:hypothetical protein
LVAVLERVLPLAGRVVGGLRTAAVVTGLAALVLWVRMLTEADPGGPSVAVAVLVLLLLLAPAAVLVLVWLSLREVLALPQRLRTLPQVGREHAAELADLAAGARDGRRRGVLGALGGLWRLSRLLVSGRDALLVHAPLVALARPALLLVLPAALVFAAVEVVSAVVVLLTQPF